MRHLGGAEEPVQRVSGNDFSRCGGEIPHGRKLRWLAPPVGLAFASTFPGFRSLPLRDFDLLWREKFVAQDGLVDLKEGGIAPIVGLARVYALEAGSQSRSTIDRLEDAAHAGSLSQQGAETLAETFRFLQWLRLRGQLDEITSKREPDNKIRLDQLSHLEKRYLKDAFLAIREIQESAELRFRLAMLG